MLVNFSVFIPLVESGSKPHTIRRCEKKGPPRVGERLYLYEGLRTKHARRLKVAGAVISRCLARQAIRIVFGLGVWLDDYQLAGPLVRQLAYQDGFRSGGVADVAAFWKFFTPGLNWGETFTGWLISWRPHTLLGVGPPPADYARADRVDAVSWAVQNILYCRCQLVPTVPADPPALLLD